MAYLNLFYRVQSAIADSSAESDELAAKGDQWMRKALDAGRKDTQNGPKPAPNLAVVSEIPVFRPVVRKKDPSLRSLLHHPILYS
jgi:hypothetical protein